VRERLIERLKARLRERAGGVHGGATAATARSGGPAEPVARTRLRSYAPAPRSASATISCASSWMRRRLSAPLKLSA